MAHQWPDIYILEKCTNQGTKGCLVQSDAFHYWCLLQQWRLFYPTLSWNADVVGISVWNRETQFGLLGGSVAETYLKRREKKNDGPGGKKARQTWRSWVVRHRSGAGVQSKSKSKKSCNGKIKVLLNIKLFCLYINSKILQALTSLLDQSLFPFDKDYRI